MINNKPIFELIDYLLKGIKNKKLKAIVEIFFVIAVISLIGLILVQVTKTVKPDIEQIKTLLILFSATFLLYCIFLLTKADKRILQIIGFLVLGVSAIYLFQNQGFEINKLFNPRTDSIPKIDMLEKDSISVSNIENYQEKEMETHKKNGQSFGKYKPDIKVSTNRNDTIDYSNDSFTISEIYLNLFVKHSPSKIKIYWNKDDKEGILIDTAIFIKTSDDILFSIFHQYKSTGFKKITIEMSYCKSNKPNIYYKQIEIKNLKL